MVECIEELLQEKSPVKRIFHPQFLRDMDLNWDFFRTLEDYAESRKCVDVEKLSEVLADRGLSPKQLKRAYYILEKGMEQSVIYGNLDTALNFLRAMAQIIRVSAGRKSFFPSREYNSDVESENILADIKYALDRAYYGGNVDLMAEVLVLFGDYARAVKPECLRLYSFRFRMSNKDLLMRTTASYHPVYGLDIIEPNPKPTLQDLRDELSQKLI